MKTIIYCVALFITQFSLITTYGQETVARKNPALVIPPNPGDLSSVEGIYESDDYFVEVRKSGYSIYSPCFVYKTENHWVDTYWGSRSRPQKSASFTSFSFAETSIEVKITCLASPESVVIRPLDFNIEPRVEGNSVYFTLDRPRKVSVEVNDRNNPLFIFSDAPDIPDTTATYYFGPGIHHIGLRKELHSGESVYIAGGAIVEGSFFLPDETANIVISGRGILSMGEFPHRSVDADWLAQHSAIRSTSTNHLTVEGIIFTNITGWTVAIETKPDKPSHHNTYKNLKMVSWNGNSDGIWFDGNDNIVDDCFIFNNDDIVTTQTSYNCKISNIVAWGGVWGRLFMFTDWASADNLVFENIYMIGHDGGPELILLESTTGREVTISNIVFSNVRVEDHPRLDNYHTNKFIRTGVKPERYKITAKEWRFENVTIDHQNPDEGDLYGTQDGQIYNFCFKNFKVNGKIIHNLEEAGMDKNEYAHGISFQACTSEEKN